MAFETAKNRQIFLLKLNRQESLLRDFLPRLPMSLPLLDSAGFPVSATNGSYCIVNDSSISSSSTVPVSVKPLLLYKFSAWILSLLQVKVTRFEEPKGLALI